MSELARRFRIDDGSFDPADPTVVEQFFKNGVRRGEERLMLAVLQEKMPSNEATRRGIFSDSKFLSEVFTGWQCAP